MLEYIAKVLYGDSYYSHGNGLGSPTNNDGGIYVTRSGYHPKNNAEWKCASGNCNKTTYDQEINNYVANDFCDATYKSCVVVLEVNWKKN